MLLVVIPRLIVRPRRGRDYACRSAPPRGPVTNRAPRGSRWRWGCSTSVGPLAGRPRDPPRGEPAAAGGLPAHAGDHRPHPL